LVFGVLGPLAVRGPAGGIDVSGDRRRTLLVRLLLSANDTVSVDELIEDVWRDRLPRQPVKSLQMLITYLRRRFAIECGDTVLVTRPSGYSLLLADDGLDVWRFERLVKAGRAAMGDGDAQEAAGLLSDALALWRGPALADVNDEPFAQGEITRLDQLRLTAVEERVGAQLAAGAHQDLIGELEGFVAANPLRE
jgi:DNA-binding SARP family transcriptional activator